MILRPPQTRFNHACGYPCRFTAVHAVRRGSGVGSRRPAWRQKRRGTGQERQGTPHQLRVGGDFRRLCLSRRSGPHPVAARLALPLLDLNSIDGDKLPRNLVDSKLAVQYQIVVLGRRGSRLFIGGADPTDQEAVERIKFATQLSPEWVIVEYDKLGKLLEKQGTSATETLESMAAASSTSTSPRTTAPPRRNRPTSRRKSKTHRWCVSCRRC